MNRLGLCGFNKRYAWKSKFKDGLEKAEKHFIELAKVQLTPRDWEDCFLDSCITGDKQKPLNWLYPPAEIRYCKEKGKTNSCFPKHSLRTSQEHQSLLCIFDQGFNQTFQEWTGTNKLRSAIRSFRLGKVKYCISTWLWDAPGSWHQQSSPYDGRQFVPELPCKWGKWWCTCT